MKGNSNQGGNSYYKTDPRDMTPELDSLREKERGKKRVTQRTSLLVQLTVEVNQEIDSTLNTNSSTAAQVADDGAKCSISPSPPRYVGECSPSSMFEGFCRFETKKK
jgi:hypothetical protein